jgi:hypothetical protein
LELAAAVVAAMILLLVEMVETVDIQAAAVVAVADRLTDLTQALVAMELMDISWLLNIYRENNANN